MDNESKKLYVVNNSVNYSTLHEKSCVTSGDNSTLSHSLGIDHSNAQAVTLHNLSSHDATNQSCHCYPRKKGVSLDTTVYHQSIVDNSLTLNNINNCLDFDSAIYGSCDDSCHVNRKQTDPGNRGYNKDPQLCAIQFTNWGNYNIETNCHIYIVYLVSSIGGSGTFYYLIFSSTCPYGHLLPCDMVPDGPLQIIYSLHMMGSFNMYAKTLSENDRIEAKNAAHNFKQDCDMFARYQISSI